MCIRDRGSTLWMLLDLNLFVLSGVYPFYHFSVAPGLLYRATPALVDVTSLLLGRPTPGTACERRRCIICHTTHKGCEVRMTTTRSQHCKEGENVAGQLLPSAAVLPWDRFCETISPSNVLVEPHIYKEANESILRCTRFEPMLCDCNRLNQRFPTHFFCAKILFC